MCIRDRSVTGDVTSNSDCKRIVDTTISEYGRLDTLINNVGILAPGNVVTLKETDYDKVMNVNLKSMVLVSKHVIPKMIESGGGSIVNMSSFLGLRSGSIFESVPYSVSKGGVVTLTLSMAVQHGRENIRANCILPGYIYTPMVAPHISEETRELRKNGAPLGTEGTAWDIANAALFLASEDARWVTGLLMPVDAGLLAASPLSMLPYLR